MVALHDITDETSWGVTCRTCGNRGVARRYRMEARPDLGWRILDLRAANLVRTGVLSVLLPRVGWVHLERSKPYVDRGDYTDTRGLMLVFVAHHHQRGLRLNLTDDIWDAAVFAAALNGPWSGGQLLLEHAVTPGT